MYVVVESSFYSYSEGRKEIFWYDYQSLENYIRAKSTKSNSLDFSKRNLFDIKEWFDVPNGTMETTLENLHVEFGSPILLGRFYSRELPEGYYVSSNVELKQYGFQSVVPPYQAYQEISMYFGGPLAVPMKPIPEMDDDTMRDSKGFDKFSFRKDKRK